MWPLIYRCEDAHYTTTSHNHLKRRDKIRYTLYMNTSVFAQNSFFNCGYQCDVFENFFLDPFYRKWRIVLFQKDSAFPIAKHYGFIRIRSVLYPGKQFHNSLSTPFSQSNHLTRCMLKTCHYRVQSENFKIPGIYWHLLYLLSFNQYTVASVRPLILLTMTYTERLALILMRLQSIDIDIK